MDSHAGKWDDDLFGDEDDAVGSVFAEQASNVLHAHHIERKKNHPSDELSIAKDTAAIVSKVHLSQTTGHDNGNLEWIALQCFHQLKILVNPIPQLLKISVLVGLISAMGSGFVLCSLCSF